MDITKLFQSLEEFVFQVASLVVLIPKTFFKLALFPSRTCKYVSDELQKTEESRFDSQASPLILWMVAGLVPHFIVLTVLSSLSSLSSLIPKDQIVTHLLHLSPEARFTALSIMAISLPLALAVATVRERKEKISKTSLRGPLYCFCYCLTPPLLAAIPAWYMWEADKRETSMQVIGYIGTYVDVVAIWFVYITLQVFRCQLGIGWKRSFTLLGKAYVAFFGCAMMLELGILFTVELMQM